MLIQYDIHGSLSVESDLDIELAVVKNSWTV